MKTITTLISFLLSMVLLTACTTTQTNSRANSQANNPASNPALHKSYLGKWTLVKIVYPNGDIKDFSQQPVNYIHINQTEITENMPGYGIKTYNYIEKDNTLIIMAGNRLSAWTIKNNSQNTLEIETAAGVYVLVR